jgi:amino acid adenylation domain-containing protein/thioester reductase-like protein
MHVEDGGAGVFDCHIEYDPTIFSSLQVSNIQHFFVHISQQLSVSHSGTIQQLDYLTSRDKATIQGWNSTPEPPILNCLHHCVAAHARAAYATPAVSAWDGELTYGELDRLSTRLGIYIRQKGFTKGKIVPLLFEKSKWMVVSLLAVHKVGGICACLPVSHSGCLLQSILEQTGTAWILASQEQAIRLRSMGYTAHQVPAMVEEAAPTDLSIEQEVPTSAEDTAYVVFTSGSTGVPKGVLIPHRAEATWAHYHGKVANVLPDSRVLQLASYAFDVSIIETWHALSRGACLCIPSDNQRLTDLPGFVHRHRATWAFFTPTMLRGYKPGDFPSLETICLGGENIPPDLVMEWQGSARLFNHWGPAETIGGAACEILPYRWIPGTFGYGVGCTLWITRPEDTDQLAAVGALGEVVVEGPVVAHGYLNDELKTQESFVLPPQWRSHFATPLQGSFFKTGDLAQYNLDGSVRYVSRKDTMVKINGQRVDTDMVEVHLRELEPSMNVAVAAVALQGGRRQDPILMAFVETEDGADWDTDVQIRDPVAWSRRTRHLQAQLAQRVARVMVPTFIVPVLSLPVSKTGKTDRRRLCSLLGKWSFSRLAYCLNPVHLRRTQPQKNEEVVLLKALCHALGIDPAGIDWEASFPDLGGDSVSAIQVARSLANQGLILPMEHMLSRDCSVVELAATIQPVDSLPRLPTTPIAPYSLLPDQERTVILTEASEQCGVPMEALQDVYPCTPFQEGAMSVTMAVTNSVYIDRFLFKLHPGTAVGEVQRAWDAVVDAVVILRTRIIQVPKGDLYQVVLADHTQPWAQYPSVEQFLETDRTTGMTIGTPLVRFSMISGREDGVSTTLALTLHHAIYDAWSLALLLRQFESAYHGERLMLSSFVPFVRHVLEHQDDANTTQFWQQEMADLQPISYPEYPVPDYYPRTTVWVTHEVPRNSLTGVPGPTARIRLAWALLLSLYSDTNDVVYGCVVRGRQATLPGIETLMGPTISTVPVRISLRPMETVREALEAVESRMEAMQYFEQSGLQRIAATGHEPALATRFRSLLIVQSEPDVLESLILGKADTVVGAADGFPGYGLILLCYPTQAWWHLKLLVDETLISKAKATRLLDQLAHILAQLDRNEDNRRIAELSLLCPEDEAQLSKWMIDSCPTQIDCCIQDLFTAECLRTPAKTAIEAWDGKLTYAQVDQYSTLLASDLQCRGVRRHTMTPILIEHSRWVAIAMLAILKAGGAFVLLDLDQPQTRNRLICEAVGATVILASESSKAQANKLLDTVYIVGSGTVVALATRDSLPLGACQERDVPSPGDVAYLVFTSGSTGEPKGILIQHGAYSSAILAQREKLKINSSSRVLQLSSYTFDSFSVEILTTLCSGGCVCMPSNEDFHHDIAAAIRRFNVTWMVITPSLLRLVDAEEVPSLRTVVAVGETMLPSQAEHWVAYVQLICGYGPSECCTGASATIMSSERPDVRNIGSGMGSTLWIVHKDDHHRLVPVGAVGELVIQGPIVGGGYLNRPSETKLAFLDTTNWSQWVAARVGPIVSCQSLYKTGDLARYNEDGTCTFLGRKSQQAKLRGQRVNVAEAEGYLQQAFGAASNVFAAVILPSNDHALLAAFVHHPLAADEESRLSSLSGPFCQHTPSFAERALVAQGSLHRLLPTILLPSVYLQVPTVPLMMSGKANRRMLEEAAAALTGQELRRLGGLATNSAEKLAPTEDIALKLSRWLADIIREKHNCHPTDMSILGHNVAPSQLGLDSIDVMVFSRLIMQQYGLVLPTRDLFRATLTVRDVAAMIQSSSSHATQPRSQVDGHSNQDKDSRFCRGSEQFWWRDYKTLARRVDEFHLRPASLCADAHRQPTGRVFLTGGTGYLGTQIIHQLVTKPDIQNVTVLVRARNATHAMARIVRSARVALWWREEYRRVITVWPGDLSQPRLGLSDEHWAQLCGRPASTFDAIIHNGATVHWVHDYHHLAPPNVLSTLELLSAISQCDPSVRFTYVSALMPGQPTIPDEARVPPPGSLDDGYSQTKYVSELLLQRFVRHYGSYANRIVVVRPGLMIGSMEHGVANVDDVLWRVVSTAFDIGAYNADEREAWLYICPVDWVASVVVRNTLYPTSQSTQGPLSLTVIDDGLSVGDFWLAVGFATDHCLSSVDGRQWLSLVQKRIEGDKVHPIWPVLDFLLEQDGCIGQPQRPESCLYPASLQSMIWTAVMRNAEYVASLLLDSNTLSRPQNLVFSRRH